MAHGLSCSTSCGIFLDQGLNPCPLHWQVDSQPLRHQGSPEFIFNSNNLFIFFYIILSSTNKYSFTCCCPVFKSFISFSCLIALFRTSSTMLNRWGNSGHSFKGLGKTREIPLHSILLNSALFCLVWSDMDPWRD